MTRMAILPNSFLLFLGLLFIVACSRSWQAEVERAESLVAEQRFEEAITVYQKALRDYPDHPKAADLYLKIAFAMKEGEISDPLQSDNGYHIVKVLADKKLDSFDEAKNRIRFKIQGNVKNQVVSELKEKYKIAYAETAEEESAVPAVTPPATDQQAPNGGL